MLDQFRPFRSFVGCIACLILMACSDERAVLILVPNAGSPSYWTLQVGDTLALVGQVGELSWPAKIVDDSQRSPGRFAWDASDSSVLEVSSTGRVIARAAGKSTLHVKYGQLVSLPLLIEISPRP